MHKIDPAVPLKTQELSGFALRAGVCLDWLGHVLRGTPRSLTGAMLKEYMHKQVCYSHEKATRELGWEPMDFETSLRDTIDWIRRVRPH